MYRVITSFIDLQDGEHPYNVGDAYPRQGVKVSEGRIEQLATTKNRRKMPLIAPVQEEPVKKTRRKKNDERTNHSNPVSTKG